MEENINEANIQAQMRKGLLEYCVLLLLKDDRCYTSDILKRLSESNLIVVEGTIYALLNRLRKEGKLNYEWEESPKGPPRKYFFLTDLGHKVLDIMTKAWEDMSNTVNYFNMHKRLLK